MNEFLLKSDLENLHEKNYKTELEKAGSCLLENFDNKQKCATKVENSDLISEF